MSVQRAQTRSLFDPAVLGPAALASLRKLAPQHVARNPVMFVVEVGSVLTLALWIRDLLHPASASAPPWFTGTITLWLWFTVLFANFAEAVAEGRGKAQAATLRKMRKESTARRLRDGREKEERVPASALRKGDIVVAEAGDLVPGDGEVIEGIASVDESAITGESAPVIRESGGDRSAVTGGTKVLSDRIVIRISADPGQSFLDRMIALVEGAARQKTPNEIALHILLVGLTLVFLFACVSLVPLAHYAGLRLSATVVVALLVCLIPTTIGGLLSAIGIAGMDRMLRKNVLAMSGRAVEAAGDVDTLLLDKTGTITLGNRMATELIPMPHVRIEELAAAARLASLSDETPEGRSIVALVRERFHLDDPAPAGCVFVPFSAHTRMSGCDTGARVIRKGAVEAVREHIESLRGGAPEELTSVAAAIGDRGGTPLAVSDGGRALGVIHLKDVVKGGIKERFQRFRAMGIRTVMITGDNPRTAASIASEAGVDDFLAEATPETKMRLIKAEQEKGKLVAMTGDGTNDAPALAQADVGVAMNSGTQAAKEAGNMVDLDSNPTKLLEIVEVGKQLLMTRGCLTTFSIANDVAKYFAILPALFIVAFPQIAPLNVMRLASPQSAILSAVIFNALIIILLIPLALRGVRYRPLGAAALLKRSLLLYGLGGLVAPFLGIKLIDLLLEALRLV